MGPSVLRRRSLVELAAIVGVLGCADDDSGAGTDGDSSPSPSTTAQATTASMTTSAGPTETSLETSADSTAEPPGEGWQVAQELGPRLGMAMSVGGPSASEAIVAGGQQGVGQGVGPSTGFVLRRTADGWAPDALPADTPMLHWIGQAADDVWVVGLGGAALRWEGDAWVPHATGTTVTLWGVWGSASDDVWAVGGDGIAEPPTLLRFDGLSFAEVPLPVLPPDAHALFKVWGSDAEHVFVAGDAGVLLRRAGQAWEASTPGGIAPFIALWGRNPNEVVAVGGRSNARIARWDGAAWQDTTLMPAGLNGVWLDDEGTATLVGRMGGIFELPAGELEPAPIDTPTNLVLHAVHGWDDGARMAVGGSFDSAPPWVGVVLEHPGDASP